MLGFEQREPVLNLAVSNLFQHVITGRLALGDKHIDLDLFRKYTFKYTDLSNLGAS